MMSGCGEEFSFPIITKNPNLVHVMVLPLHPRSLPISDYGCGSARSHDLFEHQYQHRRRNNLFTRSFSFVETQLFRSPHPDPDEEKMDMLWEDFNDDHQQRVSGHNSQPSPSSRSHLSLEYDGNSDHLYPSPSFGPPKSIYDPTGAMASIGELQLQTSNSLSIVFSSNDDQKKTRKKKKKKKVLQEAFVKMMKKLLFPK